MECRDTSPFGTPQTWICQAACKHPPRSSTLLRVAVGAASRELFFQVLQFVLPDLE